MGYPYLRLRRLRKNGNLRRLVHNIDLNVNNFVMPFFVCEGKNKKNPVPSMPGVYHLSVDNLLREVECVEKESIPAILLFGIPIRKDLKGSQSYSKDGIIQKAIASVKKEFPSLVVIADTCLCEYTSHGHCGIVKPFKESDSSIRDVDNDATLKILAKVAVSQAEAGADVVAPSAMMDGQVQAIREALDKDGFEEVAIMAYSAKYASSFYSPFREAAYSAPQFGDRRSYQMDIFRDAREAVNEVKLDAEEGADIVMVKPALCYLDIISKVKENFCLPVAAYSVSGEYSMIKAAAAKGWIDERKVVLEILAGIKRAGADIIITYYALDVARWIKKIR